jgi:hypothetical protein
MFVRVDVKYLQACLCLTWNLRVALVHRVSPNRQHIHAGIVGRRVVQCGRKTDVKRRVQFLAFALRGAETVVVMAETVAPLVETVLSLAEAVAMERGRSKHVCA